MAEGKQRTPPLYKYRSMTEGTPREHTLAILKTLELRYSPASKFNDPFDCNLAIALRSTKEVEIKIDEAVEGARAAIGGVLSDVALKVRKWMEDRGCCRRFLQPGPEQAHDRDVPHTG
jgi:hypothetical protein